MTFGSGTGPEDDLASLLARLDGRRPADLQDAANLARRAGLSLVAWQFGDLMARRGGTENDREEARREILREKSGLYAELADSMTRAQLIQRADGAYLRAADAAKELTAAAPDDDAAARLREAMVSKRQEARAGLSRVSDVHIVSAAAGVAHQGGCSPFPYPHASGAEQRAVESDEAPRARQSPVHHADTGACGRRHSFPRGRTRYGVPAPTRRAPFAIRSRARRGSRFVARYL